jgi:hypothetical protein
MFESRSSKPATGMPSRSAASVPKSERSGPSLPRFSDWRWYPAGAALSKKVPPVVVSVTVATIGDGVFRTTMSPPGAEWSNTRGGLNVIPLSCERQVHVLVSLEKQTPVGSEVTPAHTGSSGLPCWSTVTGPGYRLVKI